MPAKKTKEQVIIELNQRNGIHAPVYPVDENFGYEKTHQIIDWKCENGHTWSAPIVRILQGKGCPICSRKQVGDGNVVDVDKMLKRLKARNAQYTDRQVQLKSHNEYKGMTKPCTWVCMQGHEWEASPKVVVRGSYCPECKRLENVDRHTYTHDQVLAKLKARNKRLPYKKVYIQSSETYSHNAVKLNLYCDNGHTWKGRIGAVLNCNSGCPICAKSGFSHKALAWLDKLASEQQINIQHALNDGEFKIPGTKYRADGYCAENNTIYEFYGDMWHGNPSKFAQDEFNEVSNMTYGELYEKTVARENNIKNQGFQLVTMWESDWDVCSNDIEQYFVSVMQTQCFVNHTIVEGFRLSEGLSMLTIYVPELKLGIKFCSFDDMKEQRTQNKFTNRIITEEYKHKGITVIQIYQDEWLYNQQLVISKLKHYSKQSTSNRIFARKCVIREISSSEKNNFLNQYHIQGKDNSSIKLGAFYGDMLVAVMTFSPPRTAVGNMKNTDMMYELVRFTTHSDYHVVGIASKLLKHFERKYDWKQIYSFADRRWSVGNLYEQLGFEIKTINAPDYFYVIDGMRKHRWNYRKDILKNTLPSYDPSLTEYQNMINNGYDRVWGVGTIKYIKNNNLIHSLLMV